MKNDHLIRKMMAEFDSIQPAVRQAYLGAAMRRAMTPPRQGGTNGR